MSHSKPVKPNIAAKLAAYDAALQKSENQGLDPGTPKHLRLHGWAKISNAVSPERIASLLAQFKDYHRNWPEQADGFEQDMTKDVGPGSFGCVNLPSACHNDATVAAQMAMIGATKPFLKRYAEKYDFIQFQYIADRMMIRTNKQPPEAIHTDNSAGADKGDVVLAMMLCLNEGQCVSIVPGSHSLEPSMKGGDFTPSSPADKLLLKARLVNIPMEPGCVFLMGENINHGIYSPPPRKRGAPKAALYRQFLGVGFSKVEKYWLPGNRSRMEKGEVLAHKGKDEIPPTYPKLYWTNHSHLLIEECKKLKRKMVTTRTYNSGKNKGRTIPVPKSNPPVLVRYKRTAEENDRFTPFTKSNGFKRVKIEEPPVRKPPVRFID